MCKYNILIVDDEKRLVKCIEFVLALAGHKVTTANSGIEAYKIIMDIYSKGKAIDLLITDMMMPHMSGMSLIDELKKANISPVTIGISGYSDAETVVALNNRGCAGLIGKPFTPEQLIAKINEVMS